MLLVLEPRSNHVNTTEWLKHGSSQHKQRRYEHTVHFLVHTVEEWVPLASSETRWYKQDSQYASIRWRTSCRSVAATCGYFINFTSESIHFLSCISKSGLQGRWSLDRSSVQRARQLFTPNLNLTNMPLDSGRNPGAAFLDTIYLYSANIWLWNSHLQICSYKSPRVSWALEPCSWEFPGFHQEHLWGQAWIPG